MFSLFYIFFFQRHSLCVALSLPRLGWKNAGVAAYCCEFGHSKSKSAACCRNNPLRSRPQLPPPIYKKASREPHERRSHTEKEFFRGGSRARSKAAGKDNAACVCAALSFWLLCKTRAAVCWKETARQVSSIRVPRQFKLSFCSSECALCVAVRGS